MRHTLLTVIAFLAIAAGRNVDAITIVLDYTLDAQNENWFDTQLSEGLSRRNSVDAAAGFLSAIITNDDWQSLASLNEAITFTDIAASTIIDLDGNLLVGTPETDGAGYSYDSGINDVHTTNRSSVGANEYIVYVGAFAFDAATTANAKASWDSNDRRNAAGVAGDEFNTWGGKLYFNTSKDWYAGSNPGVDPTDDYGVQDSNKQPIVDITTDNWDWSTSSDTWKGFDLETIDPLADGKLDLYATAVHELMHALGATSSIIEDYVGVDASRDFIGPNLMQVYGGPVPGDGGHFAENVQSLVWDSADVVSEAVLDPNSLNGVRKYFTQLDAALLRDLGYDVLDEFPSAPFPGDFNNDGVVDAADYTVWRDNLGAPDESALNGNGDGMNGVDAGDYSVWVDNFGTTSGSGSLANGGRVPEPAAATLFCIAAIAWWTCFSRRATAAFPSRIESP